jgi:hypothetical protein
MSRKRREALAPNWPITQATFALAWDLLLKQGQGHDATDCERCHAKCWLTYRAIDGTVLFTDWLEKVNPVIPDIAALKLPPGRLQRWSASQSAAEVYLSILQTSVGDDVRAAGRLAETVAREICEGCLSHSPAVQNYLRMVAVSAYAALLTGDTDIVIRHVESGIAKWREVMTRFDDRRFGERWMEARDDMFVLMALSYMRQVAETGSAQDFGWVNPLVLQQKQKSLPWMKCLLRLEGTNGGMWSDEVPE